MKSGKIIAAVLVVLLLITGFAVVRTLGSKTTAPPTAENVEPTESVVPQVPESVKVTVTAGKNNNVILAISGMEGKMQSIAYELSYDSGGLIKGVNSGSKPIDVSGEDELTREVYLGTCSRNVCKPDTGVTAVTVSLEFTDTEGKKSQFNKDFDL
jgi:hypothetical protein